VSSETTPDPLPVGFRDVDATATEKILRCLDTLDTVRSYKASALDRLGLGPLSAALDVACGRGDDVARLKSRCARAVGIDRSATLIALAGARHANAGCEFIKAEADALPFPDETFDAVRVDRALQHIDGPGRVVREMARVARRGGVVLCAEPDWGTFLLGGPRCPVAERVEHDWVGSFRNPWIGRELSRLLEDAGLGERRWDAHWLPTCGFADSDVLFEIAATARRLARELPDALAWLDAYQAGEAYAGVLVMTCWGRKR
jgi:ubiquinone/menaquinone biosynthesis C-methylase UbiE